MSPTEQMIDESQSARSSQSISPTPNPYLQSKQRKLTPTCEVLIKEGKPNEMIISDDYFDLIGKIWAHKLRRLPANIQPIAEKAVNDALFDAEMRKFVTEDSKDLLCSIQNNRHLSTTCYCSSSKFRCCKIEAKRIVSCKCTQNFPGVIPNMQCCNSVIRQRPYSR